MVTVFHCVCIASHINVRMPLLYTCITAHNCMLTVCHCSTYVASHNDYVDSLSMCMASQNWPHITDIMVDNARLQVSTKQKCLGLMFDSTLSQVSCTHQKMSYYLHLINRHRHVLPTYLLKLLMDSLVMSHM